MIQVKKEYRKLVEIEEELYLQYEDLLFKKEVLSSPSRIERIAIEKFGFVCPDSISFERKNKIQFTFLENE